MNCTIPIAPVVAVAALVLVGTVAARGDDFGARSDNKSGVAAPAGSLLAAKRRAKLPAINQIQAPPRASKIIEGSPIGPNGDPILVWPPEEYEYPKCCGWACSCEPSE